MDKLKQVILLPLFLVCLLAGCGKNASADDRPAYFDGVLVLSKGKEPVFRDRANFIDIALTGESLGKLAAVLEDAPEPEDSVDVELWLEFYGSVLRRDSLAGRDKAYIVMDSLLRFEPAAGDHREALIVGMYESTVDTMKYQLRVIPNYRYIWNEYIYGRDIVVSKVGRWERVAPYEVRFMEDECDYVRSDSVKYRSLATPRFGKGGKQEMYFEFDAKSFSLIDTDDGVLVFWKVYL